MNRWAKHLTEGFVGRCSAIIGVGLAEEEWVYLRDRRLRYAFRASAFLPSRGRRIGTCIVPSVPRGNVHAQEGVITRFNRVMYLDGRLFRNIRLQHGN